MSLEEDGVIIESAEHWELIPYRKLHRYGTVSIPKVIRDHLGLKAGDRIDIAIRKHE